MAGYQQAYLQAYQQAQSARLRHLTFQFTPAQVEAAEEVLAQVMPRARDSPEGNPNPRGNAPYLRCTTCDIKETAQS
jgi:ParB family chromosome partitioning protein